MTRRMRALVRARRGPRRLDGHATPGTRPWRRPRLLAGIRVRLTLWYAVVLALILLLCSAAIYATEQHALNAQLDSRLTAGLHRWAGAYDARSGRLAAARDPDIAQGEEVVLLVAHGGRVVQTLAAGPLSAVKIPWDQTVRTLQAIARHEPPSVADLGLQMTTSTGATKDGLAPIATAHPALFRFTGQPLRMGQRATALLVVGVRSDVPQQLATLARTLATIMPLALLLCAGGGYWLAARALRPIGAITRTAQAIGATDLSKRLNVHGHDEVGQLAATIDHMLERLEGAFARQRQFTADAGHELRAPLTIVELEAARALARPRTPAEYRQTLAIVQQEAAQMARLIDDLLTLARADSGDAALQREEVDLGEVALDVAERLAPLARESGMALVLEALPEASVWGDRGALARMLTNIVENALKYGAGRGTQVRLRGGVRRQGEILGVWLQVADDGPGIAAEHLPRVCERFYRADPARTHNPDPEGAAQPAGARPTGSGLGLAISQGIIADHKGRLSIHSDGAHGVLIDIWLPARSSSSGSAALSTRAWGS